MSSRFFTVATLVYSLHFGFLVDCGDDKKDKGNPPPGPTAATSSRLVLAIGSKTPAASSWAPGSSQVPVLQFTLQALQAVGATASAEDVVLDQLVIDRPTSSSGDYQNGLVSQPPPVALLRDYDESGTVTSGDVVLGRAAFGAMTNRP